MLSYLFFPPIKIQKDDGKFILPIPGLKNKTMFYEEACTLYALPNYTENYFVIPTVTVTLTMTLVLPMVGFG